jgi:hypothetical protein
MEPNHADSIRENPPDLAVEMNLLGNSSGRGIVAEHVWDDGPGNAEGGSHLDQFGAELT